MAMGWVRRFMSPMAASPLNRGEISRAFIIVQPSQITVVIVADGGIPFESWIDQQGVHHHSTEPDHSGDQMKEVRDHNE
ncbi:MAG: hypothetical protein HY740_00405 [Chloroflexi bacterium]|nr:hypothetical protein [Chloroflexota bacterium]